MSGCFGHPYPPSSAPLRKYRNKKKWNRRNLRVNLGRFPGDRRTPMNWSDWAMTEVSWPEGASYGSDHHETTYRFWVFLNGIKTESFAKMSCLIESLCTSLYHIYIPFGGSKDSSLLASFSQPRVTWRGKSGRVVVARALMETGQF